MINTIINPNFTVVAPGGCNAKCEFCFWTQEKTGKNYLEKLRKTIDNLPSQFYMISISGGEPTLSPFINQILNMIDEDQFTHRVLTTNATHLMKHIDIISNKVQHINISRHHWDEEINRKIFLTNTVPDAKHISDCIDILNSRGIDVTFSCVLTDEFILTKDDIIKYVQFAKSCGASQVFMRKKHENLLPHHLEADFGSSKIIKSHDCPACRTRVQLIKGMEVHWKTSVLEPSSTIPDCLFETIFQPSGLMTYDWDGKMIIDPLDIIDSNEIKVDMNFNPFTGEKI